MPPLTIMLKIGELEIRMYKSRFIMFTYAPLHGHQIVLSSSGCPAALEGVGIHPHLLDGT